MPQYLIYDFTIKFIYSLLIIIKEMYNINMHAFVKGDCVQNERNDTMGSLYDDFIEERNMWDIKKRKRKKPNPKEVIRLWLEITELEKDRLHEISAKLNKSKNELVSEWITETYNKLIPENK